MTEIVSFGAWLKQRRNLLHLTQRQVAERASCTPATIRKIEADERRPSPELAELLAESLAVPPELRQIFVECARGIRPVRALADAQRPPEPVSGESAALPPLPPSATPFVGRVEELARLAELLSLPECRLLTVVGPGGVGKTRLALEAARRQGAAFAHGVLFVPLTAVLEPEELAPAVAHHLGLPLLGLGTPVAQLQTALRAREMLLLFDNFEHLMDGAPLVSKLLAAAPRIKVVVTSRERLNLDEEWLYPVAGFDLTAAIELFAQRAQRVQPMFDWVGQESAVRDICRLVDGLPLALELAASWTRLMPCEQIASRIRQNPDFLTAGPRNAPARHRSLRALFDHSWMLLSPAEQDALVRLTVFRDGFALEEAAAVAGTTWPVLAGLIDKSLVTGSQMAAGRYDLHALTRHYATEKLRQSGQEKAARQQHLEAYLALAKQLAPRLHGPDAIVAFTRFEQEHNNFRAALAWSLETAQSDATLHLCRYLNFFWLRRGYWREGERWTAAAVMQAGKVDSVLLCLTLTHLSTFMALQGRYMEAAPYLMQALPMARRLEEPEPLVVALTVLGQAIPEDAPALAALDEAIAIAQDDRHLRPQLAHVYTLYGDRLRHSGRYAEAADKFQQSLAVWREIGNVDTVAYALGNLGRLALQDGRLQAARGLIAESVALSRAVGNRVGLGDWLLYLGTVLLYQEELDEAEACLLEALTFYEEMGNQRGRPDVLSCLGHLALQRGDISTAARYIQASLADYQALYEQVQDLPLGSSQPQAAEVIDTLLRAGLVAAAQGAYEQATILLSMSARLQEQSGSAPSPPLQANVSRAITTVQLHLEEAEFMLAWEVGQKMLLAQALADYGRRQSTSTSLFS